MSLFLNLENPNILCYLHCNLLPEVLIKKHKSIESIKTAKTRNH